MLKYDGKVMKFNFGAQKNSRRHSTSMIFHKPEKKLAGKYNG